MNVKMKPMFCTNPTCLAPNWEQEAKKGRPPIHCPTCAKIVKEQKEQEKLKKAAQAAVDNPAIVNPEETELPENKPQDPIDQVFDALQKDFESIKDTPSNEKRIELSNDTEWLERMSQIDDGGPIAAGFYPPKTPQRINIQIGDEQSLSNFLFATDIDPAECLKEINVTVESTDSPVFLTQAILDAAKVGNPKLGPKGLSFVEEYLVWSGQEQKPKESPTEVLRESLIEETKLAANSIGVQIDLGNEQLGQLAMEFRSTKDIDQRKSIATKYSEVVQKMVNDGEWNEEPALEDQLPLEFMPENLPR